MPGSVLRVAVDTTAPIAHGITNPVDVFFDNSPVFRLEPEAALKGVRPVAWFDSATPLRSGWAYGQGYLQGGVADRRSDGRRRASCSCSGRRSRSARSRTARSSSCSTGSIWRRGSRRPRQYAPHRGRGSAPGAQRRPALQALPAVALAAAASGVSAFCPPSSPRLLGRGLLPSSAPACAARAPAWRDPSRRALLCAALRGASSPARLLPALAS